MAASEKPEKKENTLKKFSKKIEGYSYLYFCILGIDLKDFYSDHNLKEMERSLISQNNDLKEYATKKGGLRVNLQDFYSDRNVHEMERGLARSRQDGELNYFRDLTSDLRNFRVLKENLKDFFNRQKTVQSYNQFYWNFVAKFFKLPICEIKVLICLSFCLS